MAPINVRTEDQKATAGNQVSQMSVLLRSDIEDAVDRLKAVNEGTRIAKELVNAVGAKSMTDLTQFVPSTVSAAAVKLASSMGLANQVKPTFNCTVTNVPGPPIPLFYTGARLVKAYGLGPCWILWGFFMHFQLLRAIYYSVSCCRQMMPDPEFIYNALKMPIRNSTLLRSLKTKQRQKLKPKLKPQNLLRKKLK